MDRFLSACEKEILQSFRTDDIDTSYILTEDEKRAKMYIDSIMIDGKPLSLIKGRR